MPSSAQRFACYSCMRAWVLYCATCMQSDRSDSDKYTRWNLKYYTVCRVLELTFCTKLTSPKFMQHEIGFCLSTDAWYNHLLWSSMFYRENQIAFNGIVQPGLVQLFAWQLLVLQGAGTGTCEWYKPSLRQSAGVAHAYNRIRYHWCCGFPCEVAYI